MGISMNDNLSQDRYTEECLIELQQRIVRFMEVTKLLIGDQREYESSAGLRLAKFHGMLQYCNQICKFGCPMNFFGEFLESFLRDKLKRPSKRVNGGHSHRLQHDILVRSQEKRLLDLARAIVFPTKYVASLWTPDSENEIGEEQHTKSDTLSTRHTLPKQKRFSVSLSSEGQWIMDPGNFQPRNMRTLVVHTSACSIPISQTGKDTLIIWSIPQSDEVNQMVRLLPKSTFTTTSKSHVTTQNHQVFSSGAIPSGIKRIARLAGLPASDWFDWVAVN